MLVAALDTTTRSGSLAIVRDQDVIAVRVGDANRPHAGRLPSDLVHLLAGEGLTLADVDVFGVAIGPGSFTGLRIGLAAVQGLAFATGRPAVGVSAFDALATSVFMNRPDLRSHPLALWLDAQRREVFASVVRMHDPKDSLPPQIDVIDPPSVSPAASAIDRWRQEPWFSNLSFAGEGAALYRAEVTSAFGAQVNVVEEQPNLAPAIGLIAVARAAKGEAVAPPALRPLYVRRPDVELARERQRVGKS